MKLILKKTAGGGKTIIRTQDDGPPPDYEGDYQAPMTPMEHVVEDYSPTGTPRQGSEDE